MQIEETTPPPTTRVFSIMMDAHELRQFANLISIYLRDSNEPEQEIVKLTKWKAQMLTALFPHNTSFPHDRSLK